MPLNEDLLSAGGRSSSSSEQFQRLTAAEGRHSAMPLCLPKIVEGEHTASPKIGRQNQPVAAGPGMSSVEYLLESWTEELCNELDSGCVNTNDDSSGDCNEYLKNLVTQLPCAGHDHADYKQLRAAHSLLESQSTKKLKKKFTPLPFCCLSGFAGRCVRDYMVLLCLHAKV